MAVQEATALGLKIKQVSQITTSGRSYDLFDMLGVSVGLRTMNRIYHQPEGKTSWFIEPVLSCTPASFYKISAKPNGILFDVPNARYHVMTAGPEAKNTLLIYF